MMKTGRSFLAKDRPTFWIIFAMTAAANGLNMKKTIVVVPDFVIHGIPFHNPDIGLDACLLPVAHHIVAGDATKLLGKLHAGNPLKTIRGGQQQHSAFAAAKIHQGTSGGGFRRRHQLPNEPHPRRLVRRSLARLAAFNRQRVPTRRASPYPCHNANQTAVLEVR